MSMCLNHSLWKKAQQQFFRGHYTHSQRITDAFDRVHIIFHISACVHK